MDGLVRRVEEISARTDRVNGEASRKLSSGQEAVVAMEATLMRQVREAREALDAQLLKIAHAREA